MLFHPHHKVRLWAILLAAGLSSIGLVSACKKSDRPPSLPATGMYRRNVRKIDIVELVVKDSKRATHAREIYGTIAGLLEKHALDRARTANELNVLLEHKDIPEEELRAKLAEFHERTGRSYRLYVELQLQLRDTLTREEFIALQEVE